MGRPHTRAVARAVARAGSGIVAAPTALYGRNELPWVEEGECLATSYYRCGHDGDSGFDDGPYCCWDDVDYRFQSDDESLDGILGHSQVGSLRG